MWTKLQSSLSVCTHNDAPTLYVLQCDSSMFGSVCSHSTNKLISSFISTTYDRSHHIVPFVDKMYSIRLNRTNTGECTDDDARLLKPSILSHSVQNDTWIGEKISKHRFFCHTVDALTLAFDQCPPLVLFFSPPKRGVQCSEE